MGREFELKYRADREKIAAIAARFGDFSTISMETAYYDTPDHALGARHWTLRRRYENARAVCTLKTPLPDGSRGEWETDREDILCAVPELCKLGAPAELKHLTECGVSQLCAARFTRLAKTLEIPGATVELALDQGVLLGGGRELPFAEVEVELKAGQDAAAAAFAAALAEEFALTAEPRSKVQRAMALAAL